MLVHQIRKQRLGWQCHVGRLGLSVTIVNGLTTPTLDADVAQVLLDTPDALQSRSQRVADVTHVSKEPGHLTLKIRETPVNRNDRVPIQLDLSFVSSTIGVLRHETTLPHVKDLRPLATVAVRASTVEG